VSLVSKVGLVAWLCTATAAYAVVPEPAGYRMDHYRGEVPATLRGAIVINTADLAHLIKTANPILIDVLPAPSPPPDARQALPRMPLPHRDIPGSVWLPDTGRGALSPALEARFKQRLATLTHGRPGVPLAFYCLSQCWMSWNAAKRAMNDGYTHVVWYPDGADGWQSAGHSTAEITPGF
jgi:PQQ-dependent catabolism-associated CXXCW motif protein